MAVNQIGPYTFDVCQGQPGILIDAIDVIERANVSGTALRGLGRHGQRFSLRTIAREDDLDGCRQRLVTYETLVGDDPVQVTINDVDYFASEGLLFAVLAVAPVRMTKIGAYAVSTEGGESGAILIAAWQLKSIEA